MERDVLLCVVGIVIGLLATWLISKYYNRLGARADARREDRQQTTLGRLQEQGDVHDTNMNLAFQELVTFLTEKIAASTGSTQIVDQVSKPSLGAPVASTFAYADQRIAALGLQDEWKQFRGTFALGPGQNTGTFCASQAPPDLSLYQGQQGPAGRRELD